MLIDQNDLTNSELEEMGLPLDDFDEPDDDFDTLVFPDDEWVGYYEGLIKTLYHRDIA